MKFLTLATTVCFALSAVAANAAITIVQKSGNIDGDDNVLFNKSGLILEGTTVQGALNKSGSIVDFYDAGTTLVGNGGQASLEAKSGTFSKLKVKLDQTGGTYTSLIYNLDASAAGNVTFHITDATTGSIFTQKFDVDKSGQNYFQIVATEKSKISVSSFESSVGLTDVKQVRMGGVQAVPEPATMATLAVGGLGLLRRRKNRKA